MRVLGIDPGYGRLGVAILDGQTQSADDKCELLYSDCVETDKGLAFAERLSVLSKAFNDLCDKWQPERLALEKLFFTKNQKTAMQVAEVRGMLLHLAQVHNLPVYEYTPQEVKIAVAGNGSASKAAVAEMVRKFLILKNPPKRDDEYDAIAIALTSLVSLRYPQAERGGL